MKASQNLGERIKYYFSICCISFTILELILSTLNATISLMSSNLWINNIEMFAVCFCIAALMFFTDIFTKNFSKPLSIVIDLIDVSVPVFGLGGFIFHWFPIEWQSILMVFGVLTFVYLAVYGIMYINSVITSKSINQKIIKRKGEHKNDR